MTQEYSAVLLRYGEIAIKSNQTRKRMVRQLVASIKSALKEKEVPFSKFVIEYGRIFVETDHAVEVAQVASRVFGIVSTSPVIVTEAEMDIILDVGVELARQEFKEDLTFAVGGRRLGTHSFSSQDVRGNLGERILKDLADLNLSVNLSSPEQQIYVEVRDEKAYIFTQTIKGVGGLPTGTQGKVICTVSTGLDSPVAAYKVMKRGCVPVFVHYDLTPYGEEKCKNIAIRQVSRLAEYIHGYEVKLYIISHGVDMTHVGEHGPERMTCLFCKRNMMRMAREVAIIEGADAIVTGEIIGEQASQTTRNLWAINSVVCDFPILRPCVGDDKVDIERIGAEIGTYEFASEGASCCTLAPKYPTVYSDLSKLEAAEANMDLSILKELVENAEIIILRKGKRRG